MTRHSGLPPASGSGAPDPRGVSGDQPSAGPLAVARAVFWSFLGIRRKSDYAADAATLKPKHVIIAGIIGGFLFVLALIVVVQIVTAS